jgi:small subunit ribosomal protein S7
MSAETDAVKLFGKYSFEDLKVGDKTLETAISFRPVFIPHSAGRHEHRRFAKNSVNVVERLTNLIALTPKAGGKKAKALKIVEMTLDQVSSKKKDNPLKVLLAAIENSAPREDTTRVSYGGILYYQAVDISPTRRVDLALRNLVEGARKESFKSTTPFHEALASQIVRAADKDPKCFAISRKDELEKHALASR